MANSPAVTTCRATCSATTTRSRTPTGCRSGPSSARARPSTRSEVASAVGGIVMGDPDDALRQCQEWEDAGADQLVFGSGTATQEDTLETIRLMGEHVIPKIDNDPEVSTTRYRRQAAGQ